MLATKKVSSAGLVVQRLPSGWCNRARRRNSICIPDPGLAWPCPVEAKKGTRVMGTIWLGHARTDARATCANETNDKPWPPPFPRSRLTGPGSMFDGRGSQCCAAEILWFVMMMRCGNPCRVQELKLETQEQAGVCFMSEAKRCCGRAREVKQEYGERPEERRQ